MPSGAGARPVHPIRVESRRCNSLVAIGGIADIGRRRSWKARYRLTRFGSRHRADLSENEPEREQLSHGGKLETLRSKRRYFIVVAFIIAAVLTPPDVLSQSSLALPLLALYEGSIIAVRIVEKKAAAARASTSGAASAAKPAE